MGCWMIFSIYSLYKVSSNSQMTGASYRSERGDKWKERCQKTWVRTEGDIGQFYSFFQKTSKAEDENVQKRVLWFYRPSAIRSMMFWGVHNDGGEYSTMPGVDVNWSYKPSGWNCWQGECTLPYILSYIRRYRSQCFFFIVISTFVSAMPPLKSTPSHNFYHSFYCRMWNQLWLMHCIPQSELDVLVQRNLKVSFHPLFEAL